MQTRALFILSFLVMLQYLGAQNCTEYNFQSEPLGPIVTTGPFASAFGTPIIVEETCSPGGDPKSARIQCYDASTGVNGDGLRYTTSFGINPQPTFMAGVTYELNFRKFISAASSPNFAVINVRVMASNSAVTSYNDCPAGDCEIVKSAPINVGTGICDDSWYGMTYSPSATFDHMIFVAEVIGSDGNAQYVNIDNICVGPLDPCEAAFDYVVDDCGELCVQNLSQGQGLTYNWLVSGPNGFTHSSTAQDFCVQLPEPGNFSISLVVSDGTGCEDELQFQDSADFPHNPPTITCPADLTVQGLSDTPPCEGQFDFPSIPVAGDNPMLFCFVNGSPANPGQSITLPNGTHQAHCYAIDACELVSDTCRFNITVQCGSDEPCGFACCEGGPNMDVEGLTPGPLTTSTPSGWYDVINSPEVIDTDGCDSSQQSIQLWGASFSYVGQMAGFRINGVGGPEDIFEADSTYCVSFCAKFIQAPATVTGTLSVYASDGTAGCTGTCPTITTVVENLDNTWRPYKFLFTPSQNLSDIVFHNGSAGSLDLPPTILIDQVCVSKTTPIYNDSTQPVIACPSDTILTALTPTCVTSYTIPTITATDDNGSVQLTCTLNGTPVTPGQIVQLDDSQVHTLQCVAVDLCGNGAECVYSITVDCVSEDPEPCGYMVVTCSASASTPDVAAIFDTRYNSSAPFGSDWNNSGLGAGRVPSIHPSTWTVGNIGQVFGVATDDATGDIYLAATDVYALDNSSRLSATGPAGPAGIYKSNFYSPNTISALVTTVNAASANTVGSNTIPNTGGLGNGIGNVTYDYDHQQLFASNLEDGRIYRIDALTGNVLSIFDPFTLDLGNVGMPNRQETPWGIGYFAGKVYFAVRAGGHEIYSIALDASGEFMANQQGSTGLFDDSAGSSVLELTTRAFQLKVTDIAFCKTGRMLISERGGPHNATTKEFVLSGGTWSPGNYIHTGWGSGRNAAGGVSYGPKENNGVINDECNGWIWASSNYMYDINNADYMYGAHGIPAAGNTTAHYANLNTDIHIDFNGILGTGDKNGVGDVNVFNCACPPQPNLCDSLMVMADPVTCIDSSIITGNPCITVIDPVCGCDGVTYNNACEAQEAGISTVTPGACNGQNTPSIPDGCCYNIDLKQLYGPDIVGLEVDLLSSDWIFNNVNLSYPYQFGGCPVSNDEFCIVNSLGGGIPSGVSNNAIQFCIAPNDTSASIPQLVEFRWLEAINEDSTIVCRDTLSFECMPPPPVDTCFVVNDPEITCNPDDPNLYDLCFTVTNQSGFDLNYITLEDLMAPTFRFMPGSTTSKVVFPLPNPLPSGTTSQQICVPIYAGVPVTQADTLCLNMGGVSMAQDTCCHDPVAVCVPIEPCCDPCDDRSFAYRSLGTSEEECCYAIDIANDCEYDFFTKVELSIHTPGVCFGSHVMDPSLAGQFTLTGSTQQKLVFNPTAGWLPHGQMNDFVSFCLSKIDDPSKDNPVLTLDWYTVDPLTNDTLIVCQDSLITDCLSPDVSKCLEITDQEIVCLPDSNKYQYTFTVTNVSNPRFVADRLHLFVKNDLTWIPVPTGNIILLSPPIDSAQSITITTCLQGGVFPAPFTDFVFSYRLQGVAGVDCCFEEVCDTIPVPPCPGDSTCCDIDPADFDLYFDGLITPTNISDCEVCFDFSTIDSCDMLGVSLDGMPFVSPALGPVCFDSLSQGTHTFCFELERLDDQGDICIQRDSCFDVFIDCAPMVDVCPTCPAGYIAGSNLVSNGDFESGNSGFQSDYTVAGVNVNLGEYDVRSSNFLGKSDWLQTDHTTGTVPGRMLVANGPLPNAAVWRQDINVVAGQMYTFCAWVNNPIDPSRSETGPPLVEVVINGMTLVPSTAVPVLPDQWVLLSATWVAPTTTTTTLAIFNRQNVQDADVALDDISFVECVEDTSEPCCDLSMDDFCSHLAQIATPSQADDCGICFNFSQLDSCDVLTWSVDGVAQNTTVDTTVCFNELSSGSHSFRFQLQRFDRNGDLCLEKDTTVTHLIDCCIGDPCASTAITVTDDSMNNDSCCYQVNISNQYCDDYFKGIRIDLASPGAIASIQALPGFVVHQINNQSAEIFATSGMISLGSFDAFRVCASANGAFTMSISWLVPNGSGGCDAVCAEDFNRDCGNNDPRCVFILQDSVDCEQYCVKIQNNTFPGFPISSIDIIGVTPAGASITPSPRSIPSLPQGQTSDWICFDYAGAAAGEDICFYVVGHQEDVANGEPPTWCCADTVQHCFTVPDCDTSGVCCDISQPDFELQFPFLTINSDDESCEYCIGFGLDTCNYITVDLGDGVEQTFGPGGTHSMCRQFDGPGVFIDSMYFAMFRLDDNGDTCRIFRDTFDIDFECESNECCDLPEEDLMYDVLDIVSNDTIMGCDYCFVPEAECDGLLTIAYGDGHVDSLMTDDNSSLYCHSYSGTGPWSVTMQLSFMDSLGNICVSYDTTYTIATPDCSSSSDCCDGWDDSIVQNYVDSLVRTVSVTNCEACVQVVTDSCSSMLIDWGDGTDTLVSSSGLICHSYLANGNYEIEIDVARMDSMGNICAQAKASDFFDVADCVSNIGCDPEALQIFNAISPNGDGLNELLEIVDPSDECGQIDLTIYNRWGQIVYEQANYQNDWSGKGKLGDDLPDGTYYLVLGLPDLDDDNIRIHKFVDLRRDRK